MTTEPMPEIIRGDARALPLLDASVDLIVTSPPYFNLRNYGVAGQLGAEATPQEFIAALIECTREMVRVLKPSGSIFVNLGDKYDQKRKCLRLLPERYRIAATDELDLIARAVIVWAKPNALPESATDRVRRSHEDWVHLTKARHYFAAIDEVREPHVEAPRLGYGRKRPPAPGGNQGQHVGRMDHAAHRDMGQHSLGKLPSSVWEIATQPLKVPAALGVDHFAAFPMEWPRRLIQGWCPREVCTGCGEGRRPVSERGEFVSTIPSRSAGYDMPRANPDSTHGVGSTLGYRRNLTITGYACACPDISAPSTPGVVLDPFGGTGTTALVATMLGRRGISVDLSADYCRLAEWRAADPKQRARASRSAGHRVGQSPVAVSDPVARHGGGAETVEMSAGATGDDVAASRLDPVTGLLLCVERADQQSALAAIDDANVEDAALTLGADNALLLSHAETVAVMQQCEQA